MSSEIRGLGAESRPALLVSEMQKGVVDPTVTALPGLAAQVGERDIVGRIAALAAVCRQRGVPVVWSSLAPRADRAGTTANSLLSAIIVKGALVEGTPAAELADGLDIDSRDVVVSRVHGVTPFHGTELEPILRALGVTTVVLAGVSTDVALTGAAIEAVNRGFSVVLPVDCVAGSSVEAFEHRLAEFFPLLATVTDSETVAAALKSRA